MEEIIFRDIPSSLFFKNIDKKDKEENKPFTYKMSRREVIVGAGTSIAFGAVHNIESPTSFNTEIIPATQVVGGGMYWYLQRKFGLVSNFAAHGTHNFIISMFLRKSS